MEAGLFSGAKRTASMWSDLTSPLLMSILMGLDEAADFHAFSGTCLSLHSAASCCLGDFLFKRSRRFIVMLNLISHETRIMDIEADGGIFKPPSLHFNGCNDLRFIGQSNGFLIAVDIKTETVPTTIRLATGDRLNFPSMINCGTNLKNKMPFQISFALIIMTAISNVYFLVLFDIPKGTILSAKAGDIIWTRSEKFSGVWDAIGFEGSLFIDDTDVVIELDPQSLDVINILGFHHGILMESSEKHLLHLVRPRADRFADESFMAITSEVSVDTDTDTEGEEEVEVTGALSWPIDQSMYIGWHRSDRHCRASPPMSITFGVQRRDDGSEAEATPHDSFWNDFIFGSTFIAVKADPNAQSDIVADFHRVQPLPTWFSLMPSHHDSDLE